MILEEELADFLIRHHREEVYRSYRIRCLKFWREHYGDAVADKVEKIVRERWNKSSGK